MKPIRKILFLAAVAVAVSSMVPAGAVYSQAADEPGARGAADTDREKALIHKERGDDFRVRNDIGGAAGEYGKALSLYRGFPREDRFMMARYLSWAGRLDEAIRELREILSEDPGNAAARTHLARCLAWNGKLRESLEESSAVLAASPDDKDALLARASALKWSGNSNAAVSIYKGILSKGEDFDTRLGLSQAWLSDGFTRGARQGAALLKPEFPYQEKERGGLDNEIRKATRPGVAAGYSRYDDSDDNRVDRYTLSGDFWTGNWKWGAGYLHVEAADPSRDVETDELSLSAQSMVTERIAVGGFAGLNRASGGNPRTFAIGGANAEARLFDGRIGAGVARRSFADTAVLIANRIRFTEAAAHFEHPLPYRSTFRAGVTRRGYSNENRSIDLQGFLRHTFDMKNPQLAAGYRIRYLDFRKDSGGLYFDPNSYVSHRAEASIGWEAGRAYGYLVPFFGYQSYDRRGVTTNGTFGGAEGALGVNVTDSFAVELHGEGSDEAGVTASGFRYRQFGARVRWRL
ncbi:MAG: tetratricopeptide repeat protein [Thermodesulfobacteriota bacterium]